LIGKLLLLDIILFCFNLVDSDWLIRTVFHFLSRLSINNQMVSFFEVAHKLRVFFLLDDALLVGAIHFKLTHLRGVQGGNTRHLLLGLENIQKTAVGGLDGQKKVLVFGAFGNSLLL
jgi:hypothetical protein